MPAPVEFTITIASLPPGWTGDPQALATAIAERLSISPSEPWSSFINGGAQPASNVGPFLAGGVEWKVWSDGLGTYTFATQNGAGLVNATVTRDKLATDTPLSVYITDATGRPVLVSGVQGQVLSAGTAGLPGFADPATGTYFKLQLSADQSYTSDGNYTQVLFDTTAAAKGVTPDLASHRIPIPAGTTWFFGASLQIAQINGTHTDVLHYLAICPYQNTGLGIGSLDGYTPPQIRSGIQTSGIYEFVNAGYVDVRIASSADTSAINFSVEGNGVNTRFFGYRLK